MGVGWWCATCNRQMQHLRLDSSTQTKTLVTEAGYALRLVSACTYSAPIKDAIHRYKYESTPQLHTAFSRMLMDAWQTQALAEDVFVPVPLHPSRRRERGFNQSELLARDLSVNMNQGNLVHPNALARTRPTQQQAHLNASERKANVRDAFTAEAKLVHGVRRIIIVDDVLTTGATLCECADALIRGGAQDAVALTLARA